MDISKMLSGDQLVAKGVTKIDATLPEIGMKDVLPSGSWLEQKQVQSALEARKHLIEVERIEKCGALSHAEWRDDLNLAEVTKQTGGYWQYFGCHIGKKLYLKPEETLFLMEVNSLLLKHNGVTVSLQKAYSLLLSGTISIHKYKVYASLSRLGYKVYRHKELEIDKIKKETKCHITEQSDVSNKTAVNLDDIETHIERNKDHELEFDTNTKNSVDRNELKSASIINSNKVETTSSDHMDSNVYELSIPSKISDKLISINVVVESEVDSVKENLNLEAMDKSINLKSSHNSMEIDSVTQDQNESRREINNTSTVDLAIMNVDSETNNDISSLQKHEDSFEIMDIPQDSERCVEIKQKKNIEKYESNNETYLQTLLKRKTKTSNSQSLHKYFNDIPDLFKKNVITINVPNEKYIPKNIFVNNTSYLLNLDRIQIKNIREISNEQIYNNSDEADESLRRIRNNLRSDMSQFNSGHLFFANMRYPRMNQQFRPFNFWRPRNNLNYFQFNMFYQRPFMQNCSIPRFAFNNRMNNFFRGIPNSGYCNTNNFGICPSRKRTRDEKSYHLEHIKIIASKFKHLILIGNRNAFNIQSLQRLIFSYNSKFRCRLRLTDDFEIVDDSTILETIELEDDDDETKRKKTKLEVDTFKDNLNKIRVLALRLRDLEEKGIAISRPRRAFANAIRTFNKSYNADIYLNVNYEVIDRRHITLDSSSDSDCVISDDKVKKSKKLRNPFSILKKITKTTKAEQPSTSNTFNGIFHNQDESTKTVENSNTHHLKVFDDNWSPNIGDFGRQEVVSKEYMNKRILETYNNELLYDFIKNNPNNYDSWLSAKITFAEYVENTKRQFENQHGSIENLIIGSEGGLEPIIGPDDSTDMTSILKKLRIIATAKEVAPETSLEIDFDVYNRDVQNFRKSNRPKPHFRVICMTESSNFQSGEDLSGLQSKYKDGVAIVFAIVSIGSISYIQINPTDLPLYIPCQDLT